MRAKWTALMSGACLLLGSATVSAQGSLTLSRVQLDGVTPAYQYDPSRYQLRVTIEDMGVAGSDQIRNALLVDDSEASIAAQQVAAEEPEARCTPARRALLAVAGRVESQLGDAAPQQRRASDASASLKAEAAGAAVSHRSQLLAAASPAPTIIGGSASPAETVSVSTGRSEPPLIRNIGLGARQAATDSSQPAGAANVGSNARQTDQAVQSVSPSRSSGLSAARVASGPSTADIGAGVRSGVDRALSGLQGGVFSLRR